MSFAIEVNKETLPEILTSLTNFDEFPRDITYYLRSAATWYYVKYFVTRNGRMYDWAFQPQSIIEKYFDYDAEQIKTSMTLIVRKPEA